MSEQLEHLRRSLCGRRPGLMNAAAQYAVFVLLTEEERPHVLYEVRAKTLRRQPGEICFPGGRMEAGETPIQCALRETEEELGISQNHIQVLGELDFVAYRDNSILYPVLGTINASVLERMCPNPQEVGEVLRVPMSDLRQIKPLEYEYELIPTIAKNFPYEELKIPRDYSWRKGTDHGYVYPWQGYAIWGMTARITHHLLEFFTEK